MGRQILEKKKYFLMLFFEFTPFHSAFAMIVELRFSSDVNSPGLLHPKQNGDTFYSNWVLFWATKLYLYAELPIFFL